MSKYWLFSKASRSFRASTLPERSTTAVGTCLTSVLIAQPKMKSMATGTNSMSVSARRSRPSWRNSFAMMPWSRLPTSAPGGPERPELLAHARLAFAIDERHEEILHVRLDLVGPLHADAAGREVVPHGPDLEVAPRGDESHAGARADHLLDGVPLREGISGGPRVHRLELDHRAGERLGLDLRRAPVGDEPALIDEAEGVAQLRLVHVVGRHEDRRALVGQPPDDRPERPPRDRVDARGGLVEEDQPRAVHEGAREREPLPIAAGELARELARVPAEVAEAQHLLDACRAVGAGDHVDARIEHEVLLDRQVVVQREALRHVADGRLDTLRIAAQIDAQHAPLALRRLEDPTQHAERRRLPGAVGSEEAVQLAASDAEVETVHRNDPAEALREPVGDDRVLIIRIRQGRSGRPTPLDHASTRYARTTSPATGETTPRSYGPREVGRPLPARRRRAALRVDQCVGRHAGLEHAVRVRHADLHAIDEVDALLLRLHVLRRELGLRRDLTNDVQTKKERVNLV